MEIKNKKMSACNLTKKCIISSGLPALNTMCDQDEDEKRGCA